MNPPKKWNFVVTRNSKPINVLFVNFDRVLSTSRVKYSFLEEKLPIGGFYDPVIARFLKNICKSYQYLVVAISPEYDKVRVDFKSDMIAAGGDDLSDFLLDDQDLWKVSSGELDVWFDEFYNRYEDDGFYINNFLIITDLPTCDQRKLDNHLIVVPNSFDGMATRDFRAVVDKLAEFERNCNGYQCGEIG